MDSGWRLIFVLLLSQQRRNRTNHRSERRTSSVYRSYSPKRYVTSRRWWDCVVTLITDLCTDYGDLIVTDTVLRPAHTPPHDSHCCQPTPRRLRSKLGHGPQNALPCFLCVSRRSSSETLGCRALHSAKTFLGTGDQSMDRRRSRCRGNRFRPSGLFNCVCSLTSRVGTNCRDVEYCRTDDIEDFRRVPHSPPVI